MTSQLDTHIMDGSELLTNHSLSKRNDSVRRKGKRVRLWGLEKEIRRREEERKRRRESASQKKGKNRLQKRLQLVI